MKAIRQFSERPSSGLLLGPRKIRFEGGRKKGRMGVLLEFLIERSLFVCGSLSVIFVFFILSYLFVRAYPLFTLGDETRPMFDGRFSARLRENPDLGSDAFTFSMKLDDTFTASEIARDPGSWNGRTVHVTGTVRQGSILRGSRSFVLEDEGAEIPITAQRDLPAALTDGAPVIVSGTFAAPAPEDPFGGMVSARTVTLRTVSYTVTDLREDPQGFLRQNIVLVGIVENGTLDLGDRSFVIREFSPDHHLNLSVTFKTMLQYQIPNNLREDMAVTLSGSLRESQGEYNFRTTSIEVGGSEPGIYDIVAYTHYETRDQTELFRDQIRFEGDHRHFSHSMDYEEKLGTRVTIVISWNGTQERSSIHVADPTLWDFVTGMDWNPTGRNPAELEYFGARPLIVGSILVTLGAMLFAIPLGIGSAIFISELAPPRVRDFLKLGSEILAGIPSVVYGLFGLLILTTWIQVNFDKPTGETWLAGSILLGIMALPTIISVAEDAISAVGRELKEGSLALGATRWQTISRVIIPSSISGITAAVILGMGRAMGETMAVMMVTGNAPQVPNPITDVFTPIKTLTGAIGVEMGEAAVGSNHQYALFMLAVLLFVMVLIINSTAIFLMKRIREKHYGKARSASTSKRNGSGHRKFHFHLPAGFSAAMERAVKGWIRYGGDIRLLMAGTFLFWLLSSWFGIIMGIFMVAGLAALRFASGRLDPRRFQWVAYAGVSSAMITVLFVLAMILYYIVETGMGRMSWEFISGTPSDSGRQGGIYPAITGTLLLTGGAIALSTPLGVGAGIYLAEYAREGKALRIIRAGIDNLNGTPSIVFGLFGYAFLVLYLDLGTSLRAGQITLALMVLPTIIRTTEEALKSVPHAMREGSLALGATKWETTRRVVLPPAAPGIVTGIILSIGRAAGETAPIMFTAVALTRQDPYPSLDEPVMALPYFILEMSMNIPGGRESAAGASLVLLLVVLSFYLCAALIRKRFEKGLKGFR